MRYSKLFTGLSVFLLLTGLTCYNSGCGGSGGPLAGPTPTPTPIASNEVWDFLVYLDGDNNLESYAIADFNEMEQVGSNKNVNILVLFDRNPSYDTSNGNWAGTRLYKITHDTDPNIINSQVLKDYGELDMSDPNTLRDFIIYCQTSYPADHTVLTLWNHGGGVWPKALKGAKTDNNGSGKAAARGICWDDTTGTEFWNCLTTDEVASALSQAAGATGKKVDIINMDACLMQLLEVAYEWRGLTDYLAGSEETVPAQGNNYTAVLGDLTWNASVSTHDFAAKLVTDYYNYYNGSVMNTTYSALDMSALDNFMASFNTLATELKTAFENMEDSRAAIYNSGYHCTYFYYNEIIDLYDFCNDLANNVTTDSGLVNAAIEMKTAIANLVIIHRETGGYISDTPARGLAITLPWDLTVWNNKYSGPDQYVSLKISRDTDWDEFVRYFAAYGASLGATPTITPSVTPTPAP